MMKQSEFKKNLTGAVMDVAKGRPGSSSATYNLAVNAAVKRQILVLPETVKAGASPEHPVLGAIMMIATMEMEGRSGIASYLIADGLVEAAWEHYEEQSKPRINHHD